VSIDGRVVGVSPLTIELPKGPHTFSAEAAGFSPTQRQFEVKLEAAADVTLQLPRAPTDAPLQVSTNPATGTDSPPPPPPLVSETESAPRKPYVFAWVGTGLTVAAVGVGTVLYLLASGAQSDLRSSSGTPRSLSENQQLFDKGTGLQLGAFITWGASVALAVTTALLFALEGK
jgi:hypothetical protein